jgi:hypothetical protein
MTTASHSHPPKRPATAASILFIAVPAAVAGFTHTQATNFAALAPCSATALQAVLLCGASWPPASRPAEPSPTPSGTS